MRKITEVPANTIVIAENQYYSKDDFATRLNNNVNEENGMQGAKDLANFLSKNRFCPNVIVTDVTAWGYEGEYDFSLENRSNPNRWSAEVEAALMRMDYRFVVEDIHHDDETEVYSRFGYSCLSLCIPTKGSMHSNKGHKARIETYEKYIEVLSIIAHVTPGKSRTF